MEWRPQQENSRSGKHWLAGLGRVASPVSDSPALRALTVGSSSVVHGARLLFADAGTGRVSGQQVTAGPEGHSIIAWQPWRNFPPI